MALMPKSAQKVASQAAEQRTAVVDGLAQLSFLIQRTLQRHAEEHDLSMIQARLLGVLRDRAPTMNELASLLELDKSSVTGLIDRAERRGLVARMPSVADRRAVLVGLTRAGRVLVSGVQKRFEAEVLAILECLPPADRVALSDLAARVVGAHVPRRID
jgi:DNA-binding MarR family transcriptional regulator